MDFSEYAELDAIGLAEHINKGEVSAAEVEVVARNAISEKNPLLNAIISTVEGQPSSDGSLSGVPFLVKELVIHAEGVPCRAGSRALPNTPVPHDSELMTRFRKAGLNLLGSTQTPEVGYSATTETEAFGPVHNPWKTGFSAGGSSGGSGAAVAAGLVPVAHANDGGGSIRIPASCNGLIGLKPTRDRTPTGPDYSDPLFGHGIEFVLSRSVRDSALLLDEVSGPDLGAPHLIAPPAINFLASVSAAPKKLRIAIQRGSLLGTPMHEEALRAVENAATLLIELGHEVVESSLQFDFDEFAQHVNSLWCAFAAEFIHDVTRLLGCSADNKHFEAVTLSCAEFGSSMTALDLIGALNYVNRISRETALEFENFDVLLTSTACSPPPAHGTLNQNDPDLGALEWTRQTFSYAGNTPLFNSTGQPAISLPLHWTADGLPMGVQVAGRMGAEGVLLNLAAQLEEASSWHDKQRELWID